MTKLLQDWESAYSPALYDQLPRNWQRRSFLLGATKTAAALALAPLLMQLSACQRQDITKIILTEHPWPIITAVHAVLFPSDGNGPSAQDIQSTQYLHLVLQTPDFDPEERKFILDGVNWLDQFAQEKFQRAFLSLSADQHNTVLRQITQSRVGDRWVGAMLTYLLEALLSDPVYGGNPNGIGWLWLEHQPGFPRPALPYYKESR